jgi:hypothetical protein
MDAGREIAADIGHIAEAEGRSASELAREAVSLYLHLPEAARRSLRAMIASGTPDDHAAIGRAAGHAIVRLGLDHARLQASQAARHVYPNKARASEDEVVEEAVRLTREARAAAG